MSQYAATTTVSVGRTFEEIKDLLRKRGCDQIVVAESADLDAIQFGVPTKAGGYLVAKITLPARDIKDFYKIAGSWKSRTDNQAREKWEQDRRSRARALLLIIKAKLAAVDAGISTLEREFMPDLMFGRMTLEEHMGNDIAGAIAERRSLPMLGQPQLALPGDEP